MPSHFSPVRDSGCSLPPHSVRSSRRAKRIHLRIVPGKGLEVVLPLHADPSCIPQVLMRYRDWIEKALHRMPTVPTSKSAAPPDRLLLKGGSEIVDIFRKGASAGKEAGDPDNGDEARKNPFAASGPFLSWAAPARRRLVLPDASAEECLLLLREWVREEARAYLGPMLAALACESGFSYSGMSIRFQKSRWGSCSSKGGISLNACLLFLPEPLTRYILLHELCHTRQMNHSAAFWELLLALDADGPAKDKAMREAWRHVPAWIFR
jgi:predicted metal-dependent hydrolase